MDVSETAEERELYRRAYDAWVADCREHGHNGEPETFRAGWLVGLALARERAAKEPPIVTEP